jgi:hypothetical protein
MKLIKNIWVLLRHRSILVALYDLLGEALAEQKLSDRKMSRLMKKFWCLVAATSEARTKL